MNNENGHDFKDSVDFEKNILEKIYTLLSVMNTHINIETQ